MPGGSLWPERTPLNPRLTSVSTRQVLHRDVARLRVGSLGYLLSLEGRACSSFTLNVPKHTLIPPTSIYTALTVCKALCRTLGGGGGGSAENKASQALPTCNLRSIQWHKTSKHINVAISTCDKCYETVYKGLTYFRQVGGKASEDMPFNLRNEG